MLWHDLSWQSGRCSPSRYLLENMNTQEKDFIKILRRSQVPPRQEARVGCSVLVNAMRAFPIRADIGLDGCAHAQGAGRVAFTRYNRMTQHRSTRLFRARLLWWVGGFGVVVSLIGLWASGWQGQRVV